MIARNFFLILLLTFPALASSQQPKDDSSKKLIVQEVQFVDTVDETPPPPLHIKAKFKTVLDWLSNICSHDKPNIFIAEYNFGLFESPDDYILFLVGENKYHEGENNSSTRIEFQPLNMYFKLPKKEYENLDRDQLLEKLISQLKDFSNTEKFKKSFFATADRVVFETNGQTIWSKE